MKLKYVLYAVLVFAVGFAAVMAYLAFGPSSTGRVLGQATVLEPSSPPRAALPDAGRTVSGKAGKLLVAYSGDLAGSLKPCGCTEPAMGGVARRATALRDYARKHPDIGMLQVETGNALKQSENLDDPASRWIVEALNELGSQVVNTTPGDLRRLSRLAQSGRLPNPLRTTYVATNTESPAPPAKPFAIVSVTPEAGGDPVRVGILAVTTGDASAGTKSLTPEVALRRYLPEVERQSDVVVLLARTTDAELTRLPALFPSLDAIISGSPTSEGREFPRVGNTVVVEAAHGGIALGVLELSWDAAGRVQKSANTMIPLPPQVPDDARLAAIVEKAHREALSIAEEEARNAPPLSGPSLFAGSAKCRDCHEKAFKVWEKSGHAHAIDALKKTNDHFNPECVQCHVTGFGVAQGFVNVTRTPELAGVHCEGCHGPSTAHVTNPQQMHPGLGEMRAFRRRVRKEFCVRCHTHENSPRFDYEAYWPKIAH